MSNTRLLVIVGAVLLAPFVAVFMAFMELLIQPYKFLQYMWEKSEDLE